MTRKNVRKVLGQTVRLANICGKQNLLHSFPVVGTTKSSSSNNNYSTKANKENFINFPKQLHNKLMNIFVPDFKNYSSSSVNSNNNNTIHVLNPVTPKENGGADLSVEKVQPLYDSTLNPVEYKTWTKEQVCSLLVAEEENGGADLSVEDVKPLYDAGFKGTSLANIITYIQKKDEYFAMEKVKQNKDYQNVPQTTLESVVFWVDNLLKTRLYHLWTADELRENLCKPVDKGGAGLSKEQVKTWCGNFDTFIKVLGKNGNTTMARETLYETFKNAPKDISDSLVNWVNNTFTNIELQFDTYSHYVITGMYTTELFPLLMDKCMNSINISVDFERNNIILDQKKEKTKAVLGKLGKKEADWPIAFSGTDTTMDWRFSNVILPSKLEADELAKSETSFSTRKAFSSYHEFVCARTEHKITILLALSGAGKTHSLFYISNSETAFCIPLDLGAKEDIHLQSMDIALQHISSINFLPNESNDPIIRSENIKASNEVTSILTTCIVIRMLVLLKLLKQKRNEGKDLSPSMWIRFVYNGGSSVINNLQETYQPLLQEVNKKPEFLLYIIDQLKTELLHNPYSSKMIITVDEINRLISMGYGVNTIPSLDSSTNPPTDSQRYSSTLTLLSRILETCLNHIPSILSGTKINNALIEEVVSARMKEKVDLLTAYSYPTLDQIVKFSKTFLSPPNVDLGFNCTLFDAISSLLVGRRRIITNYLSQVRNLALQNPCPPDKYKSWAVNILLEALHVYISKNKNFGEDVKNFLSDKHFPEIAKVKREIGLYLLLKNRVTSKEVSDVLIKFGLQNEKHVKLINDAIIYNGLGFGKIEPTFSATTFVMTEISIMIILSKSYSIEEMKIFVNQWLQDTLNSQTNPNRNKDIGMIFEVIGALILKVLGEQLKGSPITDDPLFFHYKDTILQEFTLPSDLALVCSEHYWKYLLIPHMQPGMSDFFKNVCVFGLDQSLKIDVKSIATNISDQNKILDVNMASKFITSPSYTNSELVHNFNATDINNAFYCNDLKNVQDSKRAHRNSLEAHGKLLKEPTVRIVFDYNSHITLEQFDSMVDNDSLQKKALGKPSDFIVLFSKNNPNFMEFFRREFSDINTTIEQYLSKKKQSHVSK